MSHDYTTYGRQPPLIRPTSGLAVGGLVTAILGIPFVSIALSLMAFKETKTGVKGGHGIAVAGAIIGGMVTVVWGLLIFIVVVAQLSGQ